MVQLNNFHKSIVEQMLHILKTCERDLSKGLGQFPLKGIMVTFGGLCELAFYLCEDWDKKSQLKTILEKYLKDYPGPKIKEDSLYWFNYFGEEFFEERILFLEYILELNKKTDGKSK